jgi:hypothetical protein
VEAVSLPSKRVGSMYEPPRTLRKVGNDGRFDAHARRSPRFAPKRFTLWETRLDADRVLDGARNHHRGCDCR